MIAGGKVTMGGEEFEIAPLNFDALDAQEDNIKIASSSKGWFTKEERAAIVELVLAALQRNYPDMTREKVRSMLDLGNMHAVFKAVMATAGLEVVKPGEPKPGS